MKKILIIQTAFIGDVILATALIEKMHQFYPDAAIDFLLRKGNEGLLNNHPTINELLIWDKKNKKYGNLIAITKKVKQTKYDLLINLQRFASSGIMTAFSGAKCTVGFNKNPFSFFFTKSFSHKIGDGTHEVERNQQLIAEYTDAVALRPKLYPSESDYQKVLVYQEQDYVCMAPTSVWFTKQLPKEQWAKLINNITDKQAVYLLGGPDDAGACEKIIQLAKNKNVVNLAGKLSFLESAALMEKAQMNHVNDSAPLHICSATNAPVIAYFCSTVPSFGFGPLSDSYQLKEVKEKLTCRPCGLHGKKECPEGHFNCGFQIPLD